MNDNDEIEDENEDGIGMECIFCADYAKDDLLNMILDFRIDDNWQTINALLIHEAFTFDLVRGCTGEDGEGSRMIQLAGSFEDIHSFASYLDMMKDLTANQGLAVARIVSDRAEASGVPLTKIKSIIGTLTYGIITPYSPPKTSTPKARLEICKGHG